MDLSVLEQFNTIDLKNVGKAGFMNRVDVKFPINTQTLFDKVLPILKDDYMVLQIDEKDLMSYRTVYFDTPDNRMYKDHHNGKKERYKVRKREYLDTGLKFLEVKHKDNKGKTKKKRIEIQTSLDQIYPEEYEFLSKHIIYDPSLLKSVLGNTFKRITLVKNDMSERCTLDSVICFDFNNKQNEMKDFSVAELKHESGAPNSILQKALMNCGAREIGFSKYCTGRVVVNNNNLKTNLFKQKMILYNKIVNK